jgi:hypothetical protein
MKRSTKKSKKSKKLSRKYLKGGKREPEPVVEKIQLHQQSSHGSDWETIHVYSVVSGKYADIMSKFFADNVHKIEFALNSIMHYENIFAMGLDRTFFQELVYLGEDLPESLNPDKISKEEPIKMKEIEKLNQIHQNKNYENEIEYWVQFYIEYIRNIETPTPTSSLSDANSIKTSILNILKESTNSTPVNIILFQSKMDELKKNKDWVDIAKLARISWYKKYQLNKEYSYDSANGAIRHFVKPV